MEKTLLFSLFIGSILLSFSQHPVEEINCGLEIELAKGFKTEGTNLWPSQIIPYKITETAESARNSIRAGILALNSRTNVCLIPEGRGEVASIKFRASNNNVSSSGVGYTPTGTTIRLNTRNGGFSGTVIHEIIHSLGFWHEHQRPDRDDFIKINYDNIQSDFLHNFTARSGPIVTPYDFTSIMHYSAGAFSVNSNLPVIEGKNEEEIGSTGKLTDLDVADINHYYPKQFSCDSIYQLIPPIPYFTYSYTYDSWCKGYKLEVKNQSPNRDRYVSFWEIKNDTRTVASAYAQDTVFYLQEGVNRINLEISNEYGANRKFVDLELKKPTFEIHINPNPVQETLNFRIDGGFSKITYSIRNLQGKVFMEKTADNINCESAEKIDLSGIGTGMYYLQVHADDQTVAKAFVRR